MQKNWGNIALAGLFAISLGLTQLASGQQNSADVRIDVNLKDADMVAATRAITMKTGLQFVFEGSNEPFNRITLKVDAISAEDAIAYICQAAGAYFRRDTNGVYIISHTKPVVDTATAATALPSPKLVSMIKKIKLMHADPKAVYQQILGTVYTDKGIEELRRLTGSLGIDQVFSSSTPNTPVTTAPATPVNQTSIPTPMRNFGAPASGRESGNDIAIPGTEGANQIGGGGLGQGGGLGGGLGGGGGGGLGGGQGGGQGGANAQLRGGTGLVPASITFISYDPTDNSLIVQGTSEDDIADLQRTISLFDQAPQQVQIKVEFITTTQSLSSDLGYDFLYQRGPVFAGTSPGTFARNADPVFLNYATGNITTRLRAKLTEGRGRVVSAPIVRTLNNQPAFIFSQIQTTIFITQVQITNGISLTTSTPLSLVASTALSVAPRINGDGTITVYLTPQIQSFVGSTTGPNGEQVPNVSSQSIALVARVRNGETIVLGGLTTKSDSSNVNRIPILGDLPIIGQFFRSNSRDNSNSDLLIFVTPTIIEDDETGGG